MKIRRGIIAAVLLMIATPAFAQQIEGVPNFKDCNDGSLTKAMTDGITLGISPSPPYSNLDPSTNKVINGEQVFALSNAGHQTPQDLADYLAKWTDPAFLNTASNK